MRTNAYKQQICIKLLADKSQKCVHIYIIYYTYLLFSLIQQEIYEKLTQLKAEQNQIQSENRKKRVLGAGIFAIAVYIVLMLMLQIIGLKNNQTVNQIFMVNIAQMKDKMFRLALLAAVGFLVLIGYFVESSVKHIDSAEVNNMIKQFDEQLMDKIGVWA
ncbi:Hypothetical_protein [Hexamita inflata]|uniref:Hypothetical_protein n=1 Tax=Hexamita inflata TaxID=28002 RepID=A0AA86REI9_9EUKA|nr:Hypothetical protein HINF_LOCUS60913 [Hexamita inflata]